MAPYLKIRIVSAAILHEGDSRANLIGRHMQSYCLCCDLQLLLDSRAACLVQILNKHACAFGLCTHKKSSSCYWVFLSNAALIRTYIKRMGRPKPNFAQLGMAPCLTCNTCTPSALRQASSKQILCL
eukprot:6186177-Pleurochrysis_carterae.AAC.2